MASAWSNIVRADAPVDDPATSATAEEVAAAQATASALRDPTRRKAVVDANAVIKGFRLEHLDAVCVTVEEVRAEIRDAKGREALRALPVELTTSEPSEEALDAVKRFAAKTGDLAALSGVDIKLIALAYELEMVNHGVEHLRTEPAAPRTHSKSTNRFSKQPGWDFVPNADDWEELDEMNKKQEEAERALLESMRSANLEAVEEDEIRERERESAAEKERREEEEEKARALREKAAEVLTAQTHIDKDDGDDDGWEPAISRTTRVRRAKREERRKEAEDERRAMEAERAAASPSDAVDLEEASKRAADFFTSKGEMEEGVENDVEDGDDDDEEEVELESCVSSITADYAMQNVILQMGMKLVAPDGMRIEHLRRWVLRCHACQEITRNLSRMFCPKCGNQSLQKVEHTVTRDGVEQFGVRKKFVLRGSKYTLPAPKGGRNAKKLILREDQLMGVRLTKKQVGEDVFSAEYNEESYADTKHFSNQKTVYEIGGGDIRRNPNERRHVATNRRRK